MASVSDTLRMLDPSVRPDPYPLFAQLREASPFRVQNLPAAVIARYADCSAVLRDPRVRSDRTLSQLRRDTLQGTGAAQRDGHVASSPMFLFLDPPDHTRLRRLVSKAFTARIVQRLEPRITELADTLLDQRASARTLDVVNHFAYPISMTIIRELLGVPVEDEARLHIWSVLASRALDPSAQTAARYTGDPAELQPSGVALISYFDELVERRRDAPGEDLLSELIAAEDAGDKLTRAELNSTCVLLLVAGHETAVTLIANAMLALLRNRRELDAFRADPSRAEAVVEETLRYDPPVQFVPRVAADDIPEMNIRRGDTLIVLTAAGNRDPAEFDNPDRFDPMRKNNHHLTFGLGAHFCLGAPLGRLEARVALTRLVQRVESPKLTVDPPPYRDHVDLRGPAHVPIEFAEILPR
ncbi:cytochrome P450 [Nocardia sp. CNY236]|uniref:cytochrome P450 n=1 Tax=Nocardia sp. CNY236 TaxID=1169152 RepID=UPI001E5CC029|nr:cytochrome P450 [Nocardia sp. CNY236]